MPFIGNQPALSYTSFAKQDFSTSATTTYTLDNPVTNANELALFINFVRQEPTTAYSASGTTLTLTSATSATDDMYCVYLGKAVQTVNPPNASVGLSQLTASGTKDATTFLRGDNTFASAGVSQETGTWTSTISYSTNLSNTSPNATATVTGNYIKTGKFYFCSIPLIKAETLGLSASTDFLFFNWSTPATTSANNSSYSVVAGYNLSGRYSADDFTDGYLYQELGSSDTTVGLVFHRTTVNGTGYCKVNNTNTGNARCSIGFWTD